MKEMKALNRVFFETLSGGLHKRYVKYAKGRKIRFTDCASEAGVFTDDDAVAIINRFTGEDKAPLWLEFV